MRNPNHLLPVHLSLGMVCAFVAYSHAQTSSVLTTGEWYKIPVVEDGVYALTSDYLSTLGIDVSALNPDEIGLYGYGGGMLPQPLSADRFEDLPAIATQGVGLADGSFDTSDRLLFYAQGPNEVSFISGENYYEHTLNLYSDTAYVYLGIGVNSSSATTFIPSSISGAASMDWFPEVRWVEIEETNRDQSGREWYENPLESGSGRTYTFATPNFASQGGAVQVRAGVMIHSYAEAPVVVALNGVEIGEIATTPTTGGAYSLKGVEADDVFVRTGPNLNDNTEVTLSFQSASVSVSNAYPNYLTLTYPRQLRGTPGEPLTFTSDHFLGTPVQIEIDNVSGYTLWEVTDPQSPRIIEATAQGSQLLFDWENDLGGQFVAFQSTAVDAPLDGERIANQDLGTWNNPDLVIVTPWAFLSAAERLAQFRESWDGLSVEVVTTDQVFNQFASGQPDVSAVRNMAKYVHDQYSNFRYLLIFGRGSYDYKHLEDEYVDQNWVPVYQARNSLDPLATYSSDDYLGFLDEEEGAWEEDREGNHGLDIGIGRLPIVSLDEANVIVDKLIHYSQSTSTLGDWRQRILFLADDEDNNTHQRDAERISQYVDTSERRFFVNKLYLDAFPQAQKGSFEDSPEARQALNEAIFRGALMVNYTGHGNELAWAEEGFFREDLIDKWSNWDHLPLFITATCEFGRHDSPRRRS
ncbi:MAG TPA: hypothetical protein DCP28_25905, partial [Cytophagales bacterium]|nr:hypothetical protein [Cytophagales bacterium]